MRTAITKFAELSFELDPAKDTDTIIDALYRANDDIDFVLTSKKRRVRPVDERTRFQEHVFY